MHPRTKSSTQSDTAHMTWAVSLVRSDPRRLALLDRELAAGDGRLLHERQLEDAVVVLGLACRLVELDRQGEAPIQVAVEPLGAKHARALGGLDAALDLGGDRHLAAFDRDVDLVLAHAGQLGMDDVTLVRLGDVDADALRCRAVRALRTQEIAEQRFHRRIDEWIVELQAGHDSTPSLVMDGRRAPPTCSPSREGVATAHRCTGNLGSGAAVSSACRCGRTPHPAGAGGRRMRTARFWPIMARHEPPDRFPYRRAARRA